MKCIVFLLLSINVLVLQAQDSAIIYYRLAAKQYDLRMYKEAEDNLKKSIAIHPTDSAYTLMSYLHRNDKTIAISYLDSAIMLKPSMWNFIRRAIPIRAYANEPYDTVAAITYLEMAIFVAPDSAEGYRRLAGQVSEIGKYDEAVKYYNKAYEFDTNPCVRYFRGMFYRHHEKYKEALDDLMATYNCEVHFKEQLFAGMIADCMLQLKDTVGACSFLKKEALARSVSEGKDMYINHCLTNTAEIFYWQGLYDVDKKNYDFAIHSFSKSIAASPSDSAYWQRGKCYRGDANHTKAIADFDTAIMLNRNNAEAYIDRAIRKLALNDTKGALVDLDKAISLNPRLPSAYWIKAEVYGNKIQQKYKQAIEILNKGIVSVPSSGNMYRYRGDAYRSMSKYKEAIDDYTKALSLDASFKELIYTGRAECREELGDKKGACEDWFEAAVAGNKKSKEKYLNNCGL